MIHLYKLKTGETIITRFLRIDETAGRQTVFVIKNPKVVEEERLWDGDDLDDWIPFVTNLDTEIPLPKDQVILGYEEDCIDAVLLELYRGWSED